MILTEIVPNYRPFLLEGGQWTQVIVFIVFLIFRYLRWTQMHDLSNGHKILGQFVLVCLIVGLILMMFVPQNITMIRVLVYGSLTLYEAYNYFYFQRYPVSLDEENTVFDIDIITKPPFLALQPLLNYVFAEPDRDPFWVRHWFRNASLCVLFLLLCAYGFTRTIQAYTDGVVLGTKQAIDEQKRTEVKTKAVVKDAVTTAVASATIAIQQVADTLKQGQEYLNKKLESNNQASVARAAVIKKDLRRFNAQIGRPAPIIINAPQQPTIRSTNFSLPPEKVKQVKPSYKAKYGNKFGSADSDNSDPDTTHYARVNAY